MLIGTSARNLEQLASFLSMLQLTHPDFEFDACRKFKSPDAAIGLVMRCIRELVKPDLKLEAVAFATPLFELAPRAEISFITTNYDLVLELGGRATGCPLRPTAHVCNARNSLEFDMPSK